MVATNALTDLFSALPSHLSAHLFANAKPVHLAAEQVLFLAGDAGDGCYRIEKGLLKVSMVSTSGAERILSILGPGAIVGELAVLDGLPRSASVLALRGSVALTLLELAEHFGENVGSGRIVIRQKFGQSDLAAMAGIARENVNRILADWKRRKLVSRISGYYCLESKSQLQ